MTAKSAPSSSTSAWGALRNRTFRTYFMAEAISATGSWMQLAAVNWQIYALTGSLMALGLVGLVRVVPIIVLSLLGGVVADTYDRRKLMIWTNSLMLITALILAMITFTNVVTLILIYLATATLSGINAFDKPAATALLPRLVTPADLPKAVRLNVIMIEISAVLGPMVAGLLLGTLGAGAAYLFNAVSFLPMIVVLLLLHVPHVRGEKSPGVSWKSMADGWKFVRHTPLLWSSTLLDFFATFFASAMALLPVFASDILKVGPQGYGILYAAPAVGSMLGALAMGQWAGRIKRQGAVLLSAVGLYGVATILFGLSTTFWLSLALLAFTGVADAVSMVIRQSLRLLLTPDHMRGRMQSVTMMFFMGGPQLGELEAGAVAQAFGPVFSVITGGVGTIVATSILAVVYPGLRRYREGDALQTAEEFNQNMPPITLSTDPSSDPEPVLSGD
ncbi:MAG: MFS transporter [Anaerolineae bacterium]